jgi:hypothetical protein
VIVLMEMKSDRAYIGEGDCFRKDEVIMPIEMGPER